MTDIEIAEQAFTKWWIERKRQFHLLSEEEQKQHKIIAHEGFIKGFFIALDKVDALFKKARGENYGLQI